MSQYLNRKNAIGEIGIKDVVFDKAVKMGLVKQNYLPGYKSARYYLPELELFAKQIYEYNQTPAEIRFQESPQLFQLYMESK